MAKVTVNVENMPEVVHRLMKHLADMLRREAGAERSPAVAKRLCEIAAKFEAGQ